MRYYKQEVFMENQVLKTTLEQFIFWHSVLTNLGVLDSKSIKRGEILIRETGEILMEQGFEVLQLNEVVFENGKVFFPEQ